MAAAYYGRIFVATVAAGSIGEAAAWFAGDINQLEPARNRGLLQPLISQFGHLAAMAIVLDLKCTSLHPIHPPSGFAGTTTGVSAAAIPRAERASISAHGNHAAAMVLRRLHSLADPENAPSNRVDSLFQLGRGNLALVSHSS